MPQLKRGVSLEQEAEEKEKQRTMNTSLMAEELGELKSQGRLRNFSDIRTLFGEMAPVYMRKNTGDIEARRVQRSDDNRKQLSVQPEPLPSQMTFKNCLKQDAPIVGLQVTMEPQPDTELSRTRTVGSAVVPNKKNKKKLVLSDPSNRNVIVKHTNAMGTVSFDDVPAGIYDVEVTSEGDHYDVASNLKYCERRACFKWDGASSKSEPSTQFMCPQEAVAEICLTCTEQRDDGKKTLATDCHERGHDTITPRKLVLRWGEHPRDLDAHFWWITPKTGVQRRVYFAHKREKDDDSAWLDVDVVNGFGPETVTIEVSHDTKYSYYVHNYTPDDGALAGCGADVTMFDSEGQCGVNVKIPDSGQGRVWHVLDIDGQTGEITVSNEIINVEQVKELFPGLTN